MSAVFDRFAECILNGRIKALDKYALYSKSHLELQICSKQPRGVSLIDGRELSDKIFFMDIGMIDRLIKLTSSRRRFAVSYVCSEY